MVIKVHYRPETRQSRLWTVVEVLVWLTIIGLILYITKYHFELVVL